MDNDGLVLLITSLAVVPLCTIDGSPTTVTTPRRVTTGRCVVSALPQRIRLLTNSIKKVCGYSPFEVHRRQDGCRMFPCTVHMN